jgi:Ca2+-transporting ATPase
MLTDILLIRLERALAVADRANNAVLQEREGRWTVQGDPTEGALLVAAPEHFFATVRNAKSPWSRS